jgi:hypothetical protein
MALSDSRIESRMEATPRDAESDYGIAKGLLHGAGIGALAGAVIVSLGHIQPGEGLARLIESAPGRALLVLAGMGAGGAAGALSGILKTTARDLLASLRSDKMA